MSATFGILEIWTLFFAKRVIAKRGSAEFFAPEIVTSPPIFELYIVNTCISIV
jgi:hypothetical protein